MARGAKNYDEAGLDENGYGLPGIKIDRDTFVVLASRLGREQQPLPKRDPEDPKEEQKYFVPEAFERGDVISRTDIWEDPTGRIDNVARLLGLGAIGYMDHPDALDAIRSLRGREQLEAQVMAERGRGLVPTAVH